LERAGEPPRGLLALALVGIPAIDRALGQAMEAHDELFAAPARAPVIAHARRERPDEAGILVKALDHARARRQAIAHAFGRAPRELGVEGNDRDLVAAGKLFQPLG